MLSLENYGLLSVFVRRTNLFCLQHLQNAFFSRHKHESNRLILYFLSSWIIAFSMKMIANFPIATKRPPLQRVEKQL